MDILARGMAASAESKADLAVNMVSDFPSGLRYMGKVNELSDLPASADIGDAYTVVNEDNREYAWDGSEWNTIGPDLDAYALKSDLAPVATTGDYDDLTDAPIEKAEGDYSIKQVVEDPDSHGSSFALGKWSFAEGRSDYVEGTLKLASAADNQVYAQANENYNVRSVRNNAILWVYDPDNNSGAYFYVVYTDRTAGTSTITLDTIDRKVSAHSDVSRFKIEAKTKVDDEYTDIDKIYNYRAYMGAAAASCSHVEGNFNNTVWLYSDTELNENNVHRSHAEGTRTLAAGYAAHTEGGDTLATGNHAHAENNSTKATGHNSHSEGYYTVASGDQAHSGGNNSIASGDNTFAHGLYVNSRYGAAFGKYNEDKVTTLFEVGNGTGTGNARHNAFAVDEAGFVEINDMKYYMGKTLSKSDDVDKAINAGVYKVGFTYVINGETVGYGKLEVVPYFSGAGAPYTTQYFTCTGEDSISGHDLTQLRKCVWLRTSNGGTTSSPNWNDWVKINDYNSLLNKPITKSGNNYEVAGPILISGKDGTTAKKIAISNSGGGQITNENTATLFGFTDNNVDTLTVGHSNYNLNLRGKGSRPKFNGSANVALTSDIPVVSSQGNYSVQQTVDTEAGQALALGKWSFAEGRMDYVEGTIKSVYDPNDQSSSLVVNQITASADSNYNIRNVRVNAILWIYPSSDETAGAYFYVTATDRGTPNSTITLDALSRDTKAESGSTKPVTRTVNITTNMKFRAYMGAAAASCSHTEGNFNNTVWLESDKEINESNVNRSHAEGSRTIAAGFCAHSEGENTQAIGGHTHTEGINTKAMADCAHAEGNQSVALTANSHAEGEKTIAGRIDGSTQYVNAHAQGSGSKALGNNTFAGGYQAEATNDHAFAHGYYVTANRGGNAVPGRGVFGRYNVDKTDTLFEIGNGTDSEHSNAFEVAYNGSARVKTTLFSDQVITNHIISDSFKTTDASGPSDGRYIAFGPGVEADFPNQVAIGQYNTTCKDAIAISKFTLSENTYCEDMIIRIGQFDNNGLEYLLYNPQLKNLTTGTVYNIGNFDYSNMVSTDTDQKWFMRDASSKFANGGTINGYPAVRVNVLPDGSKGWAYLQYRHSGITLEAGEYELSVMSPNNNILSMPTLQIFSGYSSSTQLNSNQFEKNGVFEYAFVIGNGDTDNDRQNAFAVDKAGNARVQSGIYIGDTYIDEDKLQRLLALLS